MIKYIEMWLTETDVRLCAKFVFDIEFVGDIRNGCSKCHPWEIAMLCVETNQKFYAPILPQLSAREINEAFTSTEGLSHEYIVSLNAQYPGTVYRMLAAWVQKMLVLSQKSTAILISHNCFASDMQILCEHMFRHGVCFTCPILFFDSLLFCRYIFRGHNISDFALENLFRICDNKNTKDEGLHRAVGDTVKLHSVLLPHYNNLSGLACFPGLISLTTIAGIGTSTARSLCMLGICDLRHLRHICLKRHGTMSKDAFAHVLSSTGVMFATDVAEISQNIINALAQID